MSCLRRGMVATAVWVFLAIGVALADDDGPPVEEVFELELVYPQEKDEFQFTLAPRFSSGEEAEAVSFPIVMEYGLSDRWQIGLSWEAWTRISPDEEASSEGMGDLELELTRAWMEAGEGLHLGLSLGVTYPLGDVDEDLSEGLAEYEVAVLAARELPGERGLVLLAQLGIAFVDRVDEPEDDDDLEPDAHEIEAGIGFLIPFEDLTLSLELSGSDNTWNQDGEERELYLTAGLTGDLGESWQLGVGVGAGLNDDSDDTRVSLLLTTEF